MTDSHDKKEDRSRNSRTINVEIPSDYFQKMFNMMARTVGSDRAGSGCCEPLKSNCCPQSETSEGREFNIVLKVKE